MEYYPETCNQCGGNDTAYRQFFIKPDENCPMEYKSSAPPTKLMLTPKKACKAEVILYNPKADQLGTGGPLIVRF